MVSASVLKKMVILWCGAVCLSVNNVQVNFMIFYRNVYSIKTMCATQE